MINTGKLEEATAEVQKGEDLYCYQDSPLNKTEETILLEEIARALIAYKLDSSNPPVTVELHTADGRDQIYAHTADGPINLTELLSLANLNHLMFTKEEIAGYISCMPPHDQIPTQADFQDRILSADLPEYHKSALTTLEYGEQVALYRYTAASYPQMQQFLRGNYGTKNTSGGLLEIEGCPKDSIVQIINGRIEKTLLNTVVAVHALNKLPDYTGIDIDYIKAPYLIRGQGVKGYNVDDLILHAKASEVTQESAFTSTSLVPLQRFNGGVQIIFHDVPGKIVWPLAQIPRELEFLIPPTQLKWTGHSIAADGTHIFVVTGANVLLESKISKAENDVMTKMYLSTILSSNAPQEEILEVPEYEDQSSSMLGLGYDPYYISEDTLYC